MKVLSYFLLISFASLAHAQTFIYVNEDSLYDEDPTRANTVSAFEVGAGGALTAVAGSPFFVDTGHFGCFGGGFAAANRITTAGDFLYAANCRSFSISGFEIDPATGQLTLLPSSPTLLLPVPVGGYAEGISIATTPDGQYLVATTDTDQLTQGLIHVFSISGAGDLTEIGGSPFPIACPSIAGIKISPNGSYLAVACPSAVDIFMFSIGAGGSLAAVPGSPFDAGTFPPGVPMGIDINCANDLLFSGVATGGAAAVGVFDLGADGSLVAIAGSPFQPAGGGTDSQVVLLSPDDQLLFVSNQGEIGVPYTESVSVFTVGPGGSLGPVAGSPFPSTGYLWPAGLATDPAGAYLYATSWNPVAPGFGFGYAYGYSVAAGGALTTVPGALGNLEDGLPQSLTAYPTKSCTTTDTVEIPVDIKFCSDPNGHNCRANGVLPVTVFGTSAVDAGDIDIATLRLCLAGDPSQCTGAPVSWTLDDRGDPDEDIGAPMCAVVNGVQQRYLSPDGLTDLDVAFDNREVAELIGCAGLSKGDVSPTLILKGETTGGQNLASIPVNDIGIDQLLIQKK